jgi:hypothetical protein
LLVAGAVGVKLRVWGGAVGTNAADPADGAVVPGLNVGAVGLNAIAPALNDALNK